MSGPTDNLVLEHLHYLRSGIDEMRLEIKDMKTRISLSKDISAACKDSTLLSPHALIGSTSGLSA